MCKFGVLVPSVNHGFFEVLEYNPGHSHIGHSKSLKGITIPMTICLLIVEEREGMQNVNESLGNNGIGQNFMRGKFDEYLICTTSSNDGIKKDNIALMLETFKHSKEIYFTTLSDKLLSLFDMEEEYIMISLSPVKSNMQKYDKSHYYDAKKISNNNVQVAFNNSYHDIHDDEENCTKDKDEIMLTRLPLFC